MCKDSYTVKDIQFTQKNSENYELSFLTKYNKHSLKKVLEKKKQFEFMKTLKQLAKAVQSIHQHDIVHNRLTLDNIFIKKEQVKIGPP